MKIRDPGMPVAPPRPARGRQGEARVPVWVLAALAGLVAFSAFAGLRVLLSRRAEAAAQALIGLNPRAPGAIDIAPAPPPVKTAQIDHIREVLDPGVRSGAVSIEATANLIVIRLADHAFFAPAAAAVNADARPLLMYVALALDDASGAVKVVGHSGGEPVAGAGWASDFELSLERAKSIAALLQQSLSRPERVTALGRGADIPIASNTTGKGRDRNSRVEILVLRED